MYTFNLASKCLFVDQCSFNRILVNGYDLIHNSGHDPVSLDHLANEKLLLWWFPTTKQHQILYGLSLIEPQFMTTWSSITALPFTLRSGLRSKFMT